MSLLELMQEIKESGFDPRKDSASGNSRIPVGEYPVVITALGFNIADSGWEYVQIQCEILDGEFAGQTEYFSIHFMEDWKGKETPKFVLQRNLKLARKLATFANIKQKAADWEDGYSIAEMLKPAVGLQVTLEIKETKNKKDPDSPYRNYDFFELEDTTSTARATEIDDDDLPF